MLYRSIQFGCFDIINATIGKAHHQDTGWRGVVSSFAAAMVSTLIAIPLAYPMDSVRRRLMVDAGKPSDEQLYKGRSSVCARMIFKEEGVRGFYKGVNASVFRSCGSAIVPVSYHKMQVWYDNAYFR